MCDETSGKNDRLEGHHAPQSDTELVSALAGGNGKDSVDLRVTTNWIKRAVVSSPRHEGCRWSPHVGVDARLLGDVRLFLLRGFLRWHGRRSHHRCLPLGSAVHWDRSRKRRLRVQVERVGRHRVFAVVWDARDLVNRNLTLVHQQAKRSRCHGRLSFVLRRRPVCGGRLFKSSNSTNTQRFGT
jgi:hypothetical protein